MKFPLFVIAALAALPLCADDGTFQNEASAAFLHEGAKIEEPLVAVGGEPSSAFDYRGDSTSRALSLLGTHLFRPAMDDGVTPFSQLSFVSRASSISAGFSLAAGSDDSKGSSRGQNVTITSELTGDSNLRAAALSGEWFFLRGTAARAALSGTWRRETDATRQIESPSGRGDLASLATRTSSGRFTFGVAQRFAGSGPRAVEAEVAAEGSYGWRDLDRTDQLLFSEGGFRTFHYAIDGDGWSAALAARGLLLERRLLVEARGAYDSSTADLSEVDVRPLESSDTITRSLAGGATWFFCRSLGLSARASYGTSSTASGLVSQARVAAVRTVGFGAGASWFPTPRASLSVSATRVVEETLQPPQGETFVKLKETALRLELGGALRF